MSVLFKLVGIKVEKNTKSEILCNFGSKNSINLSDILSIFDGFGLNIDKEKEKEIKFITDSETIKKENSYKISSDSKRVIFIFSMNSDVKQEFIKIFNEHGIVKEEEMDVDADDEITKPIPEEEIKISDDIIKASNVETIKLFQDKDFLALMDIYNRNAEAFKTFSRYISSGTVLMNSLEKSDDDFLVELNEIKKLNIGKSDEEIKNALQMFNGHLNLSLRYLLTNVGEEL
jgi:hypothetical protein